MFSCIDENVPEEDYRKVVIKPKAINRGKSWSLLFCPIYKMRAGVQRAQPFVQECRGCNPSALGTGAKRPVGVKGQSPLAG